MERQIIEVPRYAFFVWPSLYLDGLDGWTKKRHNCGYDD